MVLYCVYPKCYWRSSCFQSPSHQYQFKHDRETVEKYMSYVSNIYKQHCIVTPTCRHCALWHLEMSQWYVRKIPMHITVTSWDATIRNDWARTRWYNICMYNTIPVGICLKRSHPRTQWHYFSFWIQQVECSNEAPTTVPSLVGTICKLRTLRHLLYCSISTCTFSHL